MKLKNKIKLICSTILMPVVFITSCDKQLEVNGGTPEFNVTTQATTFKVGEDVKFTFSGNAHLISFYSGEPMNEYAFKEGHIVDGSATGATLSFTSSVQGGTQANQLSILLSSNFNGNYSDLPSVRSASWTDITNRFILGTSATFAGSGAKDISDLIVPGKPVYIAYKYVTKPQAQNGLARTWMIQSFLVNSNSKVGTKLVTVADQTNAGFRIVDDNPVNAPARSSITSTRITLLGNVYKVASDPIFNPMNPIYDPTSPLYDKTKVYVPFDPASSYNDPASEHWYVSTAINTSKIDLGPDRPIAIQGNSTTPLESYSYKFLVPGTYAVTFVGANTNVNESFEVIKRLEITIIP